MSSLSIGLSGLLVSQRLIDLTGDNIANAGNPGYHLQVANLAERVNGGPIGAGVEVQDITRVVDNLLENALVRNGAAQSQSTTTLNGLNQLQSYLAPGSGSLDDALTQFLNAAETLGTSPQDPTQRRVFVSAADNLAEAVNTAANALQQMRTGLISQLNNVADQVNGLTTQIAQYNQQIHDTVATGQNANALEDLRDAAITNLSQLIDVRTVPQDFGQVNVMSAGAPLVLASTAIPIATSIDQKNRFVVTIAGSQQPLDVAGGQLGGILALGNTILPSVQSQLDSFTHALATQLDEIQAQGQGLNGPLTSAYSARPVGLPNVPLANAGLAYPPKAGDLYITVTNLATGQRTLNRVHIDPATQNLASVASSIGSIANLQATANTQTGTLSLVAAPGFGFDFTGNFSTTPDSQAITGTTAPTFTGTYTGTADETLTYTFTGSGTIGSTPGLALEVRNGAGALLHSFNVGLGYEPGSDLDTVLGVKARLSAGTVNAGDSFSLQVPANSDSAGLLPALGLNSFFTGSPGDLRVNQDLLDHPDNLALSRTGQPGDAGNLARIVALRDQPILNGNSQSLQQFLDGIIGDVGAQTQEMQARENAQDALGQQLKSQQQTVSGVDPNEELVKLVEYQRSYQMSAQFVSVVNQTLNQLIQVLGTT